MRVVVVEPRSDARTELVATLRRCRIDVAPFGDPRTAFFFLLARADEVDGILVNDDEGEWSAWLHGRLDMLSAPLPIASYSGRNPEREARITARIPGVDSDGAPHAPGDLGDLLASMAGLAGSSRVAQ